MKTDILKILIAPANYKGSVSPEKAAEYIQEGVLSLEQNILTKTLPLSDGGEGFVKSLVSAVSGRIVEVEVTGPLHDKVLSYYGFLDDTTAVVEMALASGLELISVNDRDPWKATTFGTGELILHAIKSGAKRIIVGLGGSATNDAGVGMLQALGAKFYDNHNKVVSKEADGLQDIQKLDLKELNTNIEGVEFVAACDVTNPLLGKKGASAVYGPQKGADPELVRRLDESLAHFHSVVERELGVSNAQLPGAGAAGGLGYGLVTFLTAELKSGFDIVAGLTELEDKVIWADLIITGEGKIDDQTLQGKTIHRLANLSKEHDKRLIAIGGIVDRNLVSEFEQAGIIESYAIIDYAQDVDDAMLNVSRYLKMISREVISKIGENSDNE